MIPSFNIAFNLLLKQDLHKLNYYFLTNQLCKRLINIQVLKGKEMKFSVFQQEMEHARQRKSSREGWVEERCLGTGTFGTVMLFENKVSLLTLYTPLSVYKFSILFSIHFLWY